MGLKLKTRMTVALIILFALLFGAMMFIMEILAYWGMIYGIFLFIIPLVCAVLIIVFQWAVSPVIIAWIFKIEWVDPKVVDKDIDELIKNVCAEKNINPPRFGIVRDNNPNAFTFGWTKNRSRLVITNGILKYCNKDERVAVVAHEMGHIVNNDFVVMTVVAAIPIIFYVIYRGCVNFFKYSRSWRGKGAGAIYGAAGFVALVSFIVYVISQLLALLISRYREYYADSFSAKTTNRPNSLASALVKIAYGIATEGLGEKSDKNHPKYENALMIFNAESARALVSISAGRDGKGNLENIKEAMAWDLWNPWGFFLELKLTHPLPAKRILALSKMAEELGQFPYIKFDLEKPECYWDDFFKDVFAKHSWWIAGISICLLSWFYYSQDLLLLIGMFMFTAGTCGLLYFKFYRYPKKFTNSTVLNCVRDPKASPIKGKPVRLKGKIIGRGIPGLFWSEDLKLDDGTGLILLDYHQIHKIIDFFVGWLYTEYLFQKDVIVEGWYRRTVIPYVDIYRLYVVCPDRTKVARRVWTPSAKVVCAIAVLLTGAFILLYKFRFLYGIV